MEERNVLEYAEVIIDRQRDKINELEKQLLELRSGNEELQKSILKNVEENKSLRIELNRKNNNDMVLSMHINKENEFIEKISLLENQLLKRDTLLEELNNLLKKRKYEYQILLQEKDNLKNTINILRNDICENRKNIKLKEQEFLHNEKQNDNFLNLYKNNNEELNITKRCLIQIESELHMYKKQNEQQKNEIQRLYKIINCMNKEKALIPPIVLTLQNDYQNKKIKNGYTEIKTIQDQYANKIKEKKLAKTEIINDSKHPYEKLEYDENLLKLNLMQSQEQKKLFNKILETLTNIQEKKIIHNEFDFFFSCFALHLYEKSPTSKLIYERNNSSNNSNSPTLESTEGVNNYSSNSSYNSIEKDTFTKRKKKKKKKRGKTIANSFSSVLDENEKKKKKSYNENNKHSITETENDNSSIDYSTDTKTSSNNNSSYSLKNYMNDTDNPHLKSNNKYEKEKSILLNSANYNERFIGITSQHIYIYKRKKDEEPMYIIRLQNLKNIRTLLNNKIYLIEHISYGNVVEKHYILIKDDDKSLRMFYALQYAGFIKQDMDILHKERKDEKYTSTKNYCDNENLNEELEKNTYISKMNSTISEIKVDIFTPNGIDKNGNNIPYLSNNVILRGDFKNNNLIFVNLTDDNYCINCEDYTIKYKNNKYILYFNNYKDQHIIIPKSKECTDFLMNIINQLNWDKYSEENKPNKVINTDNFSNYHEASSHMSGSFITGKYDYEDKKKLLEIERESGKESGKTNENETYKEKEYEKLKEKEYGNLKEKEYEKLKEKGYGNLKEKEYGNLKEKEFEKLKEKEYEKLKEKGYEKLKEKEYESKKDDSSSYSSSSDKNEDTFIIKNNTLYISKDGYPFKKNLVSFNDENAIKFINEDLTILKNDDLQELTIMKNKKKRNEETYIFHYPKKEKYDHLLNELSKNNFNVINKELYDKIKKEEKEKEDEEKTNENYKDSEEKNEAEIDKKEKLYPFMENNQVVVIEKGSLLIYKDYGNENSVPIMKFFPESCEVQANEVNGEIRIKDTSNNTNERIVLDCLNKTEFNRWKTALTFGGFLKGQNANNSFMNLKKHIFSINLFDNFDLKSLVKVENNFLHIYPNSNFIKPLFSFDREKIELIMISELRKIRIYLQRDTQYEQRYDITIALARDFANLKEEIEKTDFYPMNKKKTQKIKKPFVLCKTNIIAIHKNKYTLKPELILEKKNCTVKIDKNNFTITFIIKNKLSKTPEDVKSITLSNSVNFNKWIVTLKLASFISMQHNFEDNISFPSISYGHTCPEATSLLKKNNSILNFFKKKKKIPNIS
ncbi:conserved Plasmodium protein, unknown function [Plasmodium gallinaceum]|uniref:PH domain-containing protein n=1 Tax=Plasmodium gallinaceum TaxID=5849 RepID=A0A1J1GYQ4_PLAGA|nr:conserved Plasmodium protein, unknown function [Plasmodium gallinaceum]CRG97597.1 conserved Plasmodium protein, unknown function [Plasmodium gallinaceum]